MGNKRTLIELKTENSKLKAENEHLKSLIYQIKIISKETTLLLGHKEASGND